MLENVLLQFTDRYNTTPVYCRVEEVVCMRQDNFKFHLKKEIKILLLQLNTYDLTSNF